MRKIKLEKDLLITNEIILKLIESHSAERNRIVRMKNYYKNQSDIFNREYKDPNKPQNKLAHNYAGYITDSYVGYMLGNQVAYKSDNKELLDRIQEVLTYNDEADNNITVGQEQSICGYAYEIIYVDEESNVRFKAVPSEDIIAVYDNTLEENLMFAIRYYNIVSILDEEQVTQTVEVYTAESKTIYLKSDGELIYLDEKAHYFQDVPLIDYENNVNRIGDFENVISLINAYNQANSDTANDFEYFTNALLVIAGVQMEAEDNKTGLDFKNNRVLNFVDTSSRAEYLIKNINDTALENYKNRLNKDIHKFSSVLDLSDEKFTGNSSGIAMKYKLNGMENITGIKEGKFKKGLMRRLELITRILKIKTDNLMLYTEIKPVFTRNIPANETELVNIVKQLYGIISEDTLFSLLPFIESAEEEKQLKEKENEDTIIPYENFQESNLTTSDPIEEDIREY